MAKHQHNFDRLLFVAFPGGAGGAWERDNETLSSEHLISKHGLDIFDADTSVNVLINRFSLAGNARPMEMIIGLLALTLFGVGAVGWLWIVVVAFSEGETLWGVGCLFFFPLCVIYALLNFQELKIPFFMITASFVLRIVIGVITVMSS